MPADALTAAIFDRLAGDGVLDGLLARSVITPAGPAIYTSMPVPAGATLPYVVAYAGDSASRNDDTFDAGYRWATRDISAYAARPDEGGGDPSVVQAIALRIRELLHRQPISLSDGRNLIAVATGPVINDGDNAFGRVISVSYLVTEPVPA